MRATFTLLLSLATATNAAAQHPSITAGKWLRIDFRARVQADIRQSEAPTEKSDRDEDNRLDIARRRVGVEGRAAGILDYQLEYEIGAHQWRDAYIDYRQFTAFRLRAGTFKLPFGLEENTSATSLDFIHRTRISSRLAPGRDRGAMVHGKLLGRHVGYEAGFFRNDGDNARPSTDSLRVYGGRTFTARLTAQPFRALKQKPDLHLGVAITASDLPLGYPAIRARTVFGSSFFQSNIWVKGRRARTGLEARWRSGPLSVQSEYIRVSDERKGQSVEDGDLSPLLGHGWYVSGTYGIRSKRDRYGEVDAAVRYESLKFGSAGSAGDLSSSARADRVRGNTDRVLTCGVSWQLNRWIKVQANIIREQIEEPSMGPMPGRPTFWSRALRLQLAI